MRPPCPTIHPPSLPPCFLMSPFHTRLHPCIPPALIQGPNMLQGCRVPALGSSPPRSCRDHPPQSRYPPTSPRGGQAERCCFHCCTDALGWPLSSLVLCLLRARGCPTLLGDWAGLTSLDVPTCSCAARLWLQLQIKDLVFQKGKKKKMSRLRSKKSDSPAFPPVEPSPSPSPFCSLQPAPTPL